MEGDIKLYAGILMTVFAIYRFLSFFLQKNEASKSLQWAESAAPVKSNSKLIELSRDLAHLLTIQHAVRFKNPKYRNKIQKLITSAGLGSVLNVDEYIALQMLWGVLFPIFLALLNFLLQLEFSYWLCIAFAPFGFYMPQFHANAEKAQRQKKVIIDLPFFVDLMAIAAEAGISLPDAMKKIAERAPADSILAKEFSHVLGDISVGMTRAEALKKLSDRLDMLEITALVNVLVDADTSGAPVSRVLKEQSEQIRHERFVRAEKAGAKASQAIMGPVILFIVPAVFIMVAAYAGMSMMGGGK